MTAIINRRNIIFRKRRDKQVPTTVGGGMSAGGGYGVSNPVDLSKFATTADLDAYYTAAELDAGQLDNRYFTETELLDGALDSRYYTETESDTRYYTKTQLDGGQLDNRYYTETEADDRFVHLTGDETIAGVKTFSNGIKAYSAESSLVAFSSGFAGSGWKVDHNNEATFDTLNVRGTMNVYELMIQQIRASNGSIWVSDAVKASHVNNSSSGMNWDIHIDTDDGNRLVPFQVGDIIKAQRFTGRDIKSTVATVIYVDAAQTFFVVVKADVIGDDPEAGDDFVRIGSTSNAARRGALYLTASDTGNPYLDVVDGLSSASGSLTTKARLGRLDGITDADAGLDGSQTNYFGLYSDNVHLKGHIYAPSGEVGGFTLNASEGLYAGSGATRVQMKPGAGIWAGATAIGDAPFRVNQAGDMTANSGLVGGISLADDAIYTGTKYEGTEFDDDGFTIKSNGGIHTSMFYVNSAGKSGFRADEIIYGYDYNSLDVIYNAGSGSTNNNSSYTTIKAMTMGSHLRSDLTVRFRYIYRISSPDYSDQTAYIRIYVNGVAVGDEQELFGWLWDGNPVSVIEDLVVNAGDVVSVRGWLHNGAGVGEEIVVDSFRVLGEHTQIINEVTAS